MAMIRSIAELVQRITSLEAPTASLIDRLLEMRLARIDKPSAGEMQYYVGNLTSAGLGVEKVDFRANEKTGLAFLVVHARPPGPLRTALALKANYGAPASTSSNARIPPEGAIEFTFGRPYRIDMTFQFTLRSERLILISFSWPARKE